ncbi:MAG: PDZ domain-containing protein [Gammaproteobacteria bacterium]|nr:PDZ domain-containing protein [Gammaproteobacteria bacterium]
MVRYTIHFDNPNNHTFSVRMKISDPDPKGQKLALPNWIPGSYMIRDFSKNIVSLIAFSSVKKLNLLKIDKSNWRVEPCNTEIVVQYEVFSFDLSVRSAHMDNSHAFFNGTSLFLKPVGQQHHKMEVEIASSSSPFTDNWTVKTALKPESINQQGYGLYSAENYDELIDCPVEISHSVDASFVLKDTPHQVHFTGDVPASIDVSLIEKDLSVICKEHIALFDGELPPKEYRFLTMVSQNGYGGLEHKSSTALLCSPEDLPVSGREKQSDDYAKFLGLCSHEYFHLWNVKRLKPQQLKAADLSQETHTELLWFFEGVTSYYDDLALLRSGVISIEDYLGLLAKTLTRYYRAQGRNKQTLADSSFDAWTKFYKQDSNAINAIVSYYTKGAIVAFGLDMSLREKTKGHYSLDHLMRHLWNVFGREETGIEERQIEAIVRDETGQSFSEFFDLCLRCTDELPIPEWLEKIGVGLHLRPEKSADDLGGYINKANELSAQDDPALSIGCKLKPGSTVIQFVLNESPAEKAGLSPDDEIVALNNRKATAGNLEKLLSLHYSDGKAMSIHSFRRGVLHETQITPEPGSDNTCELYLLEQETLLDLQLEIQNSWRASSVR